MRFERRTRSCWSSSASRDHSRSSITLGSPASTRRNRGRSVRNPAAATRASRRSSLDRGHDLTLRGAVAGQLVRDHDTRGSALLLQQLAEQTLGGPLVAPLLDENV